MFLKETARGRIGTRCHCGYLIPAVGSPARWETQSLIQPAVKLDVVVVVVGFSPSTLFCLFSFRQDSNGACNLTVSNASASDGLDRTRQYSSCHRHLSVQSGPMPHSSCNRHLSVQSGPMPHSSCNRHLSVQSGPMPHSSCNRHFSVESGPCNIPRVIVLSVESGPMPHSSCNRHITVESGPCNIPRAIVICIIL